MIEPGAARQADALDLLAEVTGVLATSLDLRQTLPHVVRICVRWFAEYAAIDAPGAPFAGGIVQARRDELLFPELPDVALPVQESLHAHGLQSVLTIPLVGRLEVLGTLVLASRESDAFDEQASKLGNILGLQIASALEQATLFERTHRVADRLQRALLPESFPTVPGARFDAAYRPASDEAEVGGDWYDVFALPDGRVGISVGDVAGHGLEAATVMGEVRQSMRSVALGESSPSGVLETINGIVNTRSAVGMVTALFGVYSPDRRVLTYAVAGHPAPILTIPGTSAAFLPGGGVPLGVAPRVEAEDFTMTLPPAALVTFYTDGMTEYSRDVLEGEELLLDASRAAALEGGDQPATAIQSIVFASTNNRDDAAVLVLACDSGNVARQLTFSAIPLVAPIVRACVQRFCEECGMTEDQRFSVLLAVGEAIANAVEHAYRGDVRPGGLELYLEERDDAVTFRIEDHGRWRAFERRDERGRGITIMHEMMTRVRISSAANHTCVAMTLKRD